MVSLENIIEVSKIVSQGSGCVSILKKYQNSFISVLEA
jgi:hypothetical protein